jgi:hypothetical protein
MSKARKSTVLALIAGVLLLGMSTVSWGGRPVKNVSGVRHPNLAAAQKYSRMAYDKLVLAQKANEWDMEGHAQKAKELLDQVNAEIKLAAEAANEHAK